MRHFTKKMGVVLLSLFTSAAFAQVKPAVSVEVTPTFDLKDSNYYFYNAQDVLTEKRTSKLINGTWRNYWKENYTVNAQGKVESSMSYTWVNNMWSEDIRVKNTYDNGKLTVSLQETKLSGTTWAKSKQQEYIYDGSGNIDSVYIYTFDGNGNKERSERVKYEYIGSGDLAQRGFERWDNTNSTWNASKKWVYIYNFDNTLAFLEEDNYISGQWIHIHKFKYNYDNNSDVRSIEHENSATGQTIDWEFFKYEGEANFLTVDEANKTTNIVKVYPNPIRDKATLSWSAEGTYNITITDISGKTTKSFNNITENTISINGSSLKQGFYFYTLTNTNSGKHTTGKFIITR